MKFQTKLLLVAALQLSYDTAEAMQGFIGVRGDVRAYEEHDLAVLLDDNGKLLVALPTDYVVEDSEGNLSVYKEHDFINRFQSTEDTIDTEALVKESIQLEKAFTESEKALVAANAKIVELEKAAKAAAEQIAAQAKKIAELSKPVAGTSAG